ncbi:MULTISPECIES: hypothetical protein [unclassified Haloferax]|jgi:hypothetical protein|uniref:hypothetical protein n=1 Tax=unclassified Haloferax TaxID=2625095 RepID=UPI0028744495|nr:MULTISPECIES: hypothetical protein [unclassified Haloferax]MDS0241376.1 hypothetical protein [Haloferax sp. S2CR25]MDS0444497.1 hypothetical protein [Haloferax sp. S2CR25-2]
MPDDNHDIERYQDELSNAVEDGSGCAEMWEALSQQRSADATSTRRGILKGAASISALAFGIGVVPKVEAAEPDRQINIEEVDDPAERNKLRAEALADDEVKLIWKSFAKNGWTPRLKSGHVLRTFEEGGGGVEYHTVSIPFETGENDERKEANIVWSTNAEISTWGSHLVRETRDDGVYRTVTRYEVEDGAVTSKTQTVSPEDLREAQGQEQVSEQFNAQDVQAAGGFPNCTWNWNCVTAFATSGAILFGSCAICAASLNVPACIICVAEGIGFVSIDCNLCR